MTHIIVEKDKGIQPENGEQQMRLQYQWSGTDDRGDGEADLEADPPQCPDRCGGDAYITNSVNHDHPEHEIWKCSDCNGQWDGYSTRTSMP